MLFLGAQFEKLTGFASEVLTSCVFINNITSAYQELDSISISEMETNF